MSSYAEENCSKFNTTYSVASKNVYRGVGLGNSPVIGAELSYDATKWATISVAPTFNVLTPGGYGSTMKNAVTFKYEKLNLEVADMYFFNGDGANDYLSYGDSTSHLINATVKYTDKKFYGLVQGTAYKATFDENDGVYFEAGYNVCENINLNVGYVTDASTNNFRTDKGLTHIGLTLTKEVKVCDHKSKLTTTLSVNPTKNTVVNALGVSANPVQFAVGLQF
jgi:hypothetical protein